MSQINVINVLNFVRNALENAKNVAANVKNLFIILITLVLINVLWLKCTLKIKLVFCVTILVKVVSGLLAFNAILARYHIFCKKIYKN